MNGGVVIDDQPSASGTPNPDTPPATPGSLDDEFNGATFNADGRWTWEDQGGASASQDASWLGLFNPGTDSTGVPPTGIYQPTPGGTWKVQAKIFFTGTVIPNCCGGISIRDSATGNMVVFYRGVGNNAQQSIGILEPGKAWVLEVPMLFNAPVYLQVEDDGTNQVFSWSFDCVTWTEFYTKARTDFTANPDQVGLACYSDAGTIYLHYVNISGCLCCDWFRRVA